MGNEFIKQYGDVVKEVFSDGRYPYDPRLDIYIANDLKSLENIPVSEILGREISDNNLPRAVALLNSGKHLYYPLMVVGDRMYDSVYTSTFIRRNIVKAVSNDSEFVPMRSSSFGDSYQAVIFNKGLEKEELSSKGVKRLKDWVKSAVFISKLFCSVDLRRVEEKYWEQGRIIGAGVAKLAMDEGKYIRR